MLEFAGFTVRNPAYSLKKWRQLSKVRSAMRIHKINNPTCAYCGTSKKIHTHHIIPVSVDPFLAHILPNMLSLCSKCHFVVGHNKNWRSRYVNNVVEVCDLNQVTKIQ